MAWKHDEETHVEQRRSYFQEENPHIHIVPLDQQVSYPVKRANACIEPESEQETEHCP